MLTGGIYDFGPLSFGVPYRRQRSMRRLDGITRAWNVWRSPCRVLTSSGPEVKAAFITCRHRIHRLALKFHPQQDKANEGQFRQIAEAYTVLIDPVKRAKFDQYFPVSVRSLRSAFCGRDIGPGLVLASVLTIGSAQRIVRASNSWVN